MSDKKDEIKSDKWNQSFMIGSCNPNPNAAAVEEVLYCVCWAF